MLIDVRISAPFETAITMSRPRFTMLPMRLITIEDRIEPPQKQACIVEICATVAPNSARRISGSSTRNAPMKSTPIASVSTLMGSSCSEFATSRNPAAMRCSCDPSLMCA